MVLTSSSSRIAVQVDAELGATFNEVLAPQDVATYGALCSLASFSRPEMKTRIIDNIAFREFLELMPEVHSAAR
jgi:COP9 signalosome complex subunit 1